MSPPAGRTISRSSIRRRLFPSRTYRSFRPVSSRFTCAKREIPNDENAGRNGAAHLVSRPLLACASRPLASDGALYSPFTLARGVCFALGMKRGCPRHRLVVRALAALVASFIPGAIFASGIPVTNGATTTWTAGRSVPAHFSSLSTSRLLFYLSFPLR